MINNKTENEVLASMERKLMDDDLQDIAAKFKEAVSNICSSAEIFKKSGLSSQANMLNVILTVMAKSISSEKSVKNIIASIDNNLNRSDLNLAEDMLNLDLGDVNLSEDEFSELESLLLKEMSFEDEID